jgi:hypothetical protein
MTATHEASAETADRVAVKTELEQLRQKIARLEANEGCVLAQAPGSLPARCWPQPSRTTSAFHLAGGSAPACHRSLRISRHDIHSRTPRFELGSGSREPPPDGLRKCAGTRHHHHTRQLRLDHVQARSRHRKPRHSRLFRMRAFSYKLNLACSRRVRPKEPSHRRSKVPA